MFPFYRKHGFSQNSFKGSVKRQLPSKYNPEYEMTDEEFSKYIESNDNNRHQLTKRAHDRYCNKILRDKEDILLSSLRPDCDYGSDSDERTNNESSNPKSNAIRCLWNDSINKRIRESSSLPCSPTKNQNTCLCVESASRRKSETMANSEFSSSEGGVDEYIVTLKIDDLSSKNDDVSFFRIEPKLESAAECSNFGSIYDSNSVKVRYGYNTLQCRKINVLSSINLKRLLVGSENRAFPKQWLRQCFSFSHIPASCWQLVQVKPGCCGVIAAVEAYLLKCLIFDPGFCKFKEPLRPNQKEVIDAFIHALSYILWQAGDFRRGVVIIPYFSPEIYEPRSYSSDCIADSFMYVEYSNFEQLKESVATNMKYFTCSPHHGYLNFIISVILSRGIDKVLADADDDVCLITKNGHCSLELVMLLIAGAAVSNVFDNDIEVDSCLLKGVKKEVDVGLLSLFEHLNTCEVGSYLKSPRFPVWLVNYTDHFTVLFSCKKEYAQCIIEQPFVLYHYDSMTAFSCDSDTKLVIDPLANYSDDQSEMNQTNLQLCIRTKWKNAIVIYAENSELFLV